MDLQEINKEKLISNINKKDLSKTSFGNATYSDLWYVCNENKICTTFSPRGGCSIYLENI